MHIKENVKKIIACLLIFVLVGGSMSSSALAQSNGLEQLYVLFVKYDDDIETANVMEEYADATRDFLEKEYGNTALINLISKEVVLPKECREYPMDEFLQKVINNIDWMDKINDTAKLVVVNCDRNNEALHSIESASNILPENWSEEVEIISCKVLGKAYENDNAVDSVENEEHLDSGISSYDTLEMESKNISGLHVAEEKVDLDVSEYVKIYYKIANNQGGSIYVYNDKDELIKTIYDNVYHKAGYYLATWDGTDNQNKKVANGLYRIQIVFGSEEKSVEVSLETGKVKLSNVYLDKKDVNETDLVKIFYHVNKAITGNIDVFDDGGNLVKSIYDNVYHQPGYYLATWDGKNQDGNMVANGTYQIVLHFGTEEERLSVTIHSVELLKNVEVAEKHVNVDEEHVKIYYNVEKKITGSIVVFDAEHNKVKTIYDSVPHQEMRYLATWNGTDDEENEVADGEYTIELHFGSTIQKLNVWIQKSELAIDSVKVSPENVHMDDAEVRIYYNISKSSLGTISIYNEKDELIKEIYNQVRHDKGYYYAFWNIRDEDGMKVPSGKYTAKLQFEANGHKVEQNVDFIVLNEEKEVQLENVKLQSDNVNFEKGGHVQFYYSLDQGVKGNIYVLDENENVIRNIYENVKHDSGYYMAYWDGKNNDGSMVNSGTYKIRLEFGNAVKELLVKVTRERLSLSRVYLQDTSVNLETNEMAKLYYHVSKASKGTIKVYDREENLINCLYDGVGHEKGYYYLGWNAKNSEGNYVGEGTYKIKLTFTDGESEVEESVEVDIVNGFALTNVRVDEDSFNMSVSENAKLYYTINKDSYGSICIYDESGQLVKEIYNKVYHSAGTYVATWNRMDENGIQAELGTYTIHLKFEDDGVEVKEKSVNVRISDELALMNVKAGKEEIALKDGSVKIYYSVTKDCIGDIEVFDENDEKIYTLYNQVTHASGYYYAIWQFVNDKGEKVEAGNYTFKLRFTDGTVVKEKTENIIVNEGVKKVWIDAGHGGSDAGATNSGRYERDDNLRLALEVQRVLAQQGVKVYMSRTDIDSGYTTANGLSSLRKRIESANKEEVDVFVSLHRDSAGSSARGYTVYTHNSSNPENYNSNAYDNKNQGCAELAVIMNNALKNAGTFKSRGIAYGSSGSSYDLMVNRISNMPSCLLEMGYISNSADNVIFDTYLKTNAKAIAKGIMEYLKETFDENKYTSK